MKLNQHTKRKNKGMTLLELTVVILVLLSLISILFIGARAWKKGSDRAGCIMNIRNAQQAVRSYANMYDLAIGESTPANAIEGAGKFIETTPTCPGSGVYTPLNLQAAVEVPAVSTLVLNCSLAGAANENHQPSDPTGW